MSHFEGSHEVEEKHGRTFSLDLVTLRESKVGCEKIGAVRHCLRAENDDTER